jgi:hypothetical protein
MFPDANFDGRPDGPPAVFVIAYQRGKAGVRVEARGSMDPVWETRALV